MTDSFPFDIRGLRRISQTDFPDWAPSSEFQTTPDFSLESARSLLSLLPSNAQLSYLDPERDCDVSSEPAFVFVRRVDDCFFEQIGRHGYLSGWSEAPFARILSSFASCRLVRSPIDGFASFSLTSYPKH